MTDIFSTNNTTIWDEDGNYAVGVTSDGKLKVDAEVSATIDWNDLNKSVIWDGVNLLDIDATGAITANQGGAWNINDITGTISLPTGASTLAEQQSQTSHLSDIEANQTNKTQMVQITDATNEVTITDDLPKHRLDVSSVPGHYANTINEYQSYSTSRNQIEYTVPTGKVLYIVTLYGAVDIDDGGKISCEWQEDGSGFAAMSMYKQANSTVTIQAPGQAPFGPYSAGTEIRCRRLYGDSGKNWSSGFVGYLEDA